ncbi:hypothetical protein AAHA92_22451 [Salvia divinorum]|uniref:Uncharacterized protein n=1 Tax=Salvia divinorum TaxID=28513 RepID=A0ABD1GNQ8_SALDI
MILLQIPISQFFVNSPPPLKTCADTKSPSHCSFSRNWPSQSVWSRHSSAAKGTGPPRRIQLYYICLQRL